MGRQVINEEAWAMVASERRDLAELGSSLTPEQWNMPSLCDGWTVRHVFAHVLQGTALDLLALLPFLVKSRFDINRAQLLSAIA